MRNTSTDEKFTSTFEGGDRMTGAHTNRTHNVDALLQESSRTLWHTGGSRQDTHGAPVPARRGRGWPKTRFTRDSATRKSRFNTTPGLPTAKKHEPNEHPRKNTFLRALFYTISHVLPTAPDARSDSKRLNMQLFAQDFISRVPNHACSKKANSRNTLFFSFRVIFGVDRRTLSFFHCTGCLPSQNFLMSSS